MAVNYNIDEIIDGYYHGKRLLDVAYEYAATRYLLYKHGKVVENFTVSEENMSYFSEWLKQLFGETEGKNGVGILPTSTVFTTNIRQNWWKCQWFNRTNIHSIDSVETSQRATW